MYIRASVVITLVLALLCVALPGLASKGGQKSLGKVKQLRAATVEDGIQLSWQSVDKSDGYRIFHVQGKEVSVNVDSVEVGEGQTSYLFVTDSTQTFSFAVAALNGSEVGPLSPRVTVKGNNSTGNTRSDTGI
ncbi:hypothetical protein P9J64_00585 [Deltaproteobacteria bacterium IMCC39524]|nr:hypothetical protein [Deltaproteobacteria bacterium IMCC39524]